MKWKNFYFLILLVLLVLFIISATHEIEAITPKINLPEDITETIEKAFPQAVIIKTTYEEDGETGQMFYEVNLKDGEQNLEVQIAPDGSIGKIENEVTIKDIPKAHADAILKAVQGASIKHIGRHEIIGILDGGTFIPIKKSRIMYKVKYYLDQKEQSIGVFPSLGSVMPLEIDEFDEEDIRR